MSSSNTFSVLRPSRVLLISRCLLLLLLLFASYLSFGFFLRDSSCRGAIYLPLTRWVAMVHSGGRSLLVLTILALSHSADLHVSFNRLHAEE